jgi:hypothetical protein
VHVAFATIATDCGAAQEVGMTDLVVLGLSAVQDAVLHLRETSTPFLMAGVGFFVASLWAFAMAQRQPQRPLARSAVRALQQARRRDP